VDKKNILQDLLNETEELVLLELDQAEALQERVKKAITQIFGADSKYSEEFDNIHFKAMNEKFSQNMKLVQYGFHNARKRIVKLIEAMIGEVGKK
jgi:hypothetical protein